MSGCDRSHFAPSPASAGRLSPLRESAAVMCRNCKNSCRFTSPSRRGGKVGRDSIRGGHHSPARSSDSPLGESEGKRSHPVTEELHHLLQGEEHAPRTTPRRPSQRIHPERGAIAIVAEPQVAARYADAGSVRHGRNTAGSRITRPAHSGRTLRLQIRGRRKSDPSAAGFSSR